MFSSKIISKLFYPPSWQPFWMPEAVIQPRATPALDVFRSTIVFRPTTSCEVSKIIMGAPDKQCSYDPAPSSLVKRLCPVRSGTIGSICNASFVEGVLWPNQKHAIVRSRLKKLTLDPDDFNSYRPNSNLSILLKTVERVAAVRFNERRKRTICFHRVRLHTAHTILPKPP